MSVRTLHVTEYVQGGIATYLRTLLAEQAADPEHADFRVLAAREHLAHLHGIAPDRITAYDYARRSPAALLGLARALRAEVARYRPDIVHLHSTFPGAIGRVVLAALGRHRPKVVYCAHGVAFAMETTAIRRALYRGAEQALARLCDRILCISAHERTALLEAGVPAAKLALIHNGLPPEAPSAAPVEVPTDARLVLLFIGRYDRQKGLDVLLAAMARLVDQPIVLLCAGAAVVHESTRHAFPPNAIDLGWQTPGQITALVARADAVIVPSRWEGFGLVALEAMRGHRAVIASRRGALPEIVVDGATGLLVELAPEPLAAALANLDRAQLAAYGDAGHARFAARFTAAQMYAATRSVYRALLAASPAPPPSPR